MILAYVSITGNVREFVERTGMKSHEINIMNPFHEIGEDYIVIVPSYEDEINDDVEDFIEYGSNLEHLVGFGASGNLNFDNLYCINGVELSEKYDKELIMKFEFSGTDEEVERFKKEVENIEITRTK